MPFLGEHSQFSFVTYSRPFVDGSALAHETEHTVRNEFICNETMLVNLGEAKAVLHYKVYHIMFIKDLLTMELLNCVQVT
jgi:hypothetical protein